MIFVFVMTKLIVWDFPFYEKVFRIVAKSEVWKFFVGVWIWEWERMIEWRIRILFLLHKTVVLSDEVTGLGPTSSSCQPALYGQYQRLIDILYIMATRWPSMWFKYYFQNEVSISSLAPQYLRFWWSENLVRNPRSWHQHCLPWHGP